VLSNLNDFRSGFLKRFSERAIEQDVRDLKKSQDQAPDKKAGDRSGGIDINRCPSRPLLRPKDLHKRNPS